MNFFSFGIFLPPLLPFFIYWLAKTPVYRIFFLIAASYLFVFSFQTGFVMCAGRIALFIYLLTNVTGQHVCPHRAVCSLLAAGIIGCFTVFEYCGFMRGISAGALLQVVWRLNCRCFPCWRRWGYPSTRSHSCQLRGVGLPQRVEKALCGCGALSLLLPEHCRRTRCKPRAKPLCRRYRRRLAEIIDYKKPAVADPPAMGETVLSVLICRKLCQPGSSVHMVNYSAGEDSGGNCTPMPGISILTSPAAPPWVTGLPCCLVSGYHLNTSAPYLATNLKGVLGALAQSVCRPLSRDYIYILLSGNRKSWLRMNLNALSQW